MPNAVPTCTSSKLTSHHQLRRNHHHSPRLLQLVPPYPLLPLHKSQRAWLLPLHQYQLIWLPPLHQSQRAWKTYLRSRRKYSASSSTGVPSSLKVLRRNVRRSACAKSPETFSLLFAASARRQTASAPRLRSSKLPISRLMASWRERDGPLSAVFAFSEQRSVVPNRILHLQ